MNVRKISCIMNTSVMSWSISNVNYVKQNLLIGVKSHYIFTQSVPSIWLSARTAYSSLLDKNILNTTAKGTTRSEH